MKLYANPTITDFQQDVNGDIKMLKIGVDKEDAYSNIQGQVDVPVLENNKTVSITENGTVEITPTAGKDGMKKVTATVNVSSSAVTPSYDVNMEAYTGSDYPVSQVGKYYCFVSSGQLHQVQGDGVSTIQHILDTELGTTAAWEYCGTCGDYGFYYQYNS